MAFVDYQDGGVLTYSELLVARLVLDGRVPRVNVIDMWVDSLPSRDGGRALWGMPKDRAVLHGEDRWRGPVATSCWSAHLGSSPLAAAKFVACARPGLRTPFRFSCVQRRRDGTRVVAKAAGSAKTGPCLATWDVGVNGPLAWLHGRQPSLSLRMTDFRLTFGS